MIITKIITKENVPRNYFVIISARMVRAVHQEVAIAGMSKLLPLAILVWMPQSSSCGFSLDTLQRRACPLEILLIAVLNRSFSEVPWLF